MASQAPPWARLAFLLPVVALVYAHARGLGPAWRGEAWFGGNLLEDRVDLLHTLAFWGPTWDRLGEAWQAGPLRFFWSGFWRVPVEVRSFTPLDPGLLLYPLRALLPLGPLLLGVHMGLLLAAILAGYGFVRDLGGGRLAAAAGALACGTSGAMLTCTARAQYAQALLPIFLAFFLGLHRIWRGRRGGVALTAAAATLALLLYWLNALLLGLGALAWIVGALLARLPSGTAPWRHLLLAAAITLVASAPAAWPMLEAMASGEEGRILATQAATPWGMASSARLAVLDAVALPHLLSPNRGWIVPVLPLLPVVVLGLCRRESLPWAALLLLSGLLLPGPVLLFSDPGGPAAEGGLPNPFYLLFHHGVPLGERLFHPLRWGVLSTTALAALVTTGWEHAALSRAHLRESLLVLALGWATWAGPWPMGQHPLPGALEEAFAPCTQVVLTPQTPQAPDRVPGQDWLLEGLVNRPFYPTRFDPDQGLPPPTPAREARSAEIQGAMRSLLETGTLPPSLGRGTCVVLDPAVSHPPPQEVRRALASLAPPLVVTVPAGSLHGQQVPLSLEVYVVR